MSERARTMPRSSIRRIFNAVKELEGKGVKILPLHIGDPDFEMPERIADGVSTAMGQGKTHYSPMPGILELRQAIARHITRRLGLSGDQAIAPENVVCSQGATQALNACLQLSCDAGASILLPEVHFPNYMQQCALGGVRAVLYPLTGEFQPQLDRLDALVDSSTRAILINTPSNPTGALFPPATLEALYAFAERRGLWLISDEAYIDYVYEGEYLSPLAVDRRRAPEQRRVLGIFSFSKSYASTGMRMGWTVCPNLDVAAQLGLLNEPLTGSLTTPLQYGMVAALELDDVAERRAVLAHRRIVAAEALAGEGFEVRPVAGGMFYFVDVSCTGLSSDVFADRLLEEERVAVVPGSGFGLLRDDSRQGGEYHPAPLADRCVRICFAIPEEQLREGMRRFGRFIARNKR